MAIGNEELMHEVFSQTLAHGNSKNEIRQRKRKREEDKKRCVSMKRSKAGTKK